MSLVWEQGNFSLHFCVLRVVRYHMESLARDCVTDVVLVGVNMHLESVDQNQYVISSIIFLRPFILIIAMNGISELVLADFPSVLLLMSPCVHSQVHIPIHL